MRCRRREFQIPAWRRSSAASPENGGQQVLALHDAIGQLVDTGRDRATLKKQVADLKHKFEQNTAIDQQIREIATRLGKRQAQRDGVQVRYRDTGDPVCRFPAIASTSWLFR